MKKITALLLAAALLACLLAGCTDDAAPSEAPAPTEVTAETAAPTEAPTQATNADYGAWRVALLTGGGSVEDRSYNQQIYEAGRAWCEERGVAFAAYEPTDVTTSALSSMIDRAVEDGSNVLLLPNWTVADAIKDGVRRHPDVRFILLDVNVNFGRDYVLPDNVCNLLFREDVLGFMAGYAAVKLGYRHLCYLGATKTAPAIRYGYGFLQGADAAALEMDVEREIAVDYVYANTLSSDAAVTSYMEETYRKKGVELCFVYGGVEGSVSEAAQKAGGAKLIGADTDRAPVLDPENGEGVTVSSAVKNYDAAVRTVLSDLTENRLWRRYSGKTVSLGVVSGEDLAANFVGLAASTRFEDGRFSEEDCAALIAALYAGEYEVSDDVKNPPKVVIAVNYLGNVK